MYGAKVQDMNWQNVALVLAGVIGSSVAVAHAFVMQRVMVRPIVRALADTPTSAPIRRLVSPLLHLSSIAWFTGGVILIAVGAGWMPQFRSAAALVVAAFYLHAAVLNGWATRGRHPGWALMALACLLILMGM